MRCRRWQTAASEFQLQTRRCAKTKWVVYAKPPFGGPDHVLKYLARYTHRVAISNRRLVALEDGNVWFHWKDYAHGGDQKIMTLTAIEFIRRFLLHVLPSGFVRIRHYGFLANRVCRDKLALCRVLLAVEPASEPAASEPCVEPEETGEVQASPHTCPSCGVGRMVIVESLKAIHVKRSKGESTLEPAGFDTS